MNPTHEQILVFGCKPHPSCNLVLAPVPFHQKVFHLAPLTMSVGFIGLGQMVPNNPNTFVFTMFFLGGGFV